VDRGRDLALVNVVKHARASSAAVRLRDEGDRVVIVVRDDGRGGADLAGAGLRGLAERRATITSSVHLAPQCWRCLATHHKGDTMTKRIQQILVGAAAVSALALGGSAIASAQQQPAQPNTPAPKSAPAAEPVGPDTDNIQSGDQTTPDVAGASAASNTSVASTTEAPGTEQAPASEQSGAAEQPGTETADNSDGPGGHADEPGNAAADHQSEGVE
jgi:hypothetical protein